MTVRTNKVNTGEVDIRNANGYEAQLKADNLTANRSVQLQDTDSSVATLLDNQATSVDKPGFFFNTATQYLSVPNNSKQLMPGSDDSTYLCQFNISSNGTEQRFCRFYVDANNYIIFGADSTKLKLTQQSAAGSTTTTSTTSFDDGKTNTFAAVRSSTTVQFYKNGIPEPAIAATLRAATGTLATARIGGDTNLSPVRGTINRLLMFNYALTAAKIAKYSTGAKLDFEDIGGKTDVLTELWTNTASAWVGGPTFTRTSISGTTAASGSTIAIHQYLPLYGGAGKRFRFRGTFSTSVTYQLWISNNALANVQSISSGTGSSFDVTFTLISNTATHFRIDVVTPNNTVMTVTNIQVDQLGAVADWEPENITDKMWYDAGQNSLHAVQSEVIADRFIPQLSPRNYIMNGAFDFWQRATSGTTSGAGGDYLAPDRWRIYGLKQGVGNAVVTAAQISSGAPLNSNYCLRIGINDAGADVAAIGQYIESKVAAAIAGKVCTVSFKLMRISSTLLARSFDCRVYYMNTADVPGTSFLSMAEGTLVSQGAVVPDIRTVSSSIWETYSFTFVAPASYSARGLCIQLGLNLLSANGDMDSNTGNLFYIGEVILNEGPVPAPFVRAGNTYADELALCQRYFRNCSIGTRIVDYGANAVYVGHSFPAMRAAPTLYTNSPVEGTEYMVSAVGGASQTGFTLSAVSLSTIEFTRFTLTKNLHGLTDGTVYLYGTSKVGLSAEI